MRLVGFLSVVILPVAVFAKTTKSVGVKGTVTCNGQTVRNGVIELYADKYSPSSDSLIAKVNTNAQGQFTIQGSSKTDTFNPQFSISHSCLSQSCTRKVRLSIPEKYVKKGLKPAELYDIGTVDMKKKYPTETKICPRP